MVTIQNIYRAFTGCQAISIDTRKDVKNTIFFAISGETYDGNRFAKEALEKGACYAVIDNAEFKKNDRYFVVDDTVKALQDIARMHRERNMIPLLGITGSNGKTTTKELISAVLSSHMNITATKGNLNNHIGLPVTILNINRDTELAVVEMGANHQGEIETLCNIAFPGVGIITNIGKAHLEGFGGFDGVIKAKNELYEFLRLTGGKAIVNADDKLLMELSEGIGRVTYGKTNADVTGHLTRYRPFISVSWVFEGKVYNCETQLYGKYNFYNVMAAITTGLNFGVPPEKINTAIANYKPADNRSQLLRTDTNNIILDAYNANPVSMKEAIINFNEYGKENPWLILGDMFELGKYSEEEHNAIVRLISEKGFENVVLVGEMFSTLDIPESFRVFKSTTDLIEYLGENPITNANILIKGSRGVSLEKILSYL